MRMPSIVSVFTTALGARRSVPPVLPALLLLSVLSALPALAVPGAAQKQAPPIPGTPKDFRVPATRSFQLPNGMQVTLAPFGTVPKVNVRLVIRTGGMDETPQTVWLSRVAGDLLNEGGSTTRNGTQLAESLAGMGGALFINVGNDEASVSADVLSEHGPGLVRVIGDLVQNPAFPASEMPRVLQARARTVAISKAQAQSQAQEKFAQVMFGDHAYGRVFPTEEQLKGYTAEQVRAFWTANTGARRSHLYVAGVYDARRMEQAIRESFGKWAAGAAATPQPVKPAATRSLSVIDRPTAVQSTIIYGLPVPGPSSEDAIPLVVTNAMLGGTFSSRITSNIREDKGYTYSPFSFLAQGKEGTYWAEQADVTTNVTGASLTEIQKEIARLRTEPPGAEELLGIQNNIAGTFVLQNSSRPGILNQLQYVNLHGLGEEWLRRYTSRIRAVTPADVQRIAQTYVIPDKMTLVVVGDRSLIDTQLQPFGGATP